MFSRLQKIFSSFTNPASASPELTFDEGDHRLAVAALIVHAMNVDGVTDSEELARLRALLMERFSLDEEQVDRLVEAAIRQDLEAMDFSNFAAVVKRAYPPEERDRIVGMMWDVALANGELHEFEDNLIWRVADVLDVSVERRSDIRDELARRYNVDISGVAG